MIGGQILKPEDMSRPLFLDSDGNPAPINIHELAEVYVLSWLPTSNIWEQGLIDAIIPSVFPWRR